MVKKIVSIIAIVIGAFMVLSGVAPMIIGAILESRAAGSIGIIGGTDGPTAVLVVGKLGIWSVIMEVLAGILFIAAGIWGCRRSKK